MEGQILTGRWFRCDRTLAQSPVSSFDQGEVIWCDRTLKLKSDRTLGASVRSTPVRFQRAVFTTGHVRSVLTGRCSAFGHHLTARFWGELTGASGHPVEAHNGLFLMRVYKYFLYSLEGLLLLIPTAEKHPWSAKKSKVLDI